MEKDVSEERSLSEIEKDIIATTDELDLKSAVAAAASRDKTACLNRLNELHKELEKRLHELRAAAPADTDWGRRARKFGEPI